METANENTKPNSSADLWEREVQRKKELFLEALQHHYRGFAYVNDADPSRLNDADDKLNDLTERLGISSSMFFGMAEAAHEFYVGDESVATDQPIN
ncbi:MAG: hypothetical protein AB7F96_05200 [Beijerinckiaceae bacterium]